MARTESRTKTAIWTDAEFRKRSSSAQRMYWLLYSQPTISLCGILALTERRWATSSADETVEQVRLALLELEEARYVLVDWDTEEVLVRTFARHDGVARSPKTWGAAWKQLDLIASDGLREAAEAGLRVLGTPPDDWTSARPTTSDTPPDTLWNGVDATYTNGVAHGVGDTTCVRVHAASSLQPPASSLQPPHETPALVLVHNRPSPQAKNVTNFDTFWDEYPRKASKPAALKAWKRITDPVAVTAGLQNWKQHWLINGTDDRHIPYPATWLNNRQWEDTPPASQQDRTSQIIDDVFRHLGAS